MNLPTPSAILDKIRESAPGDDRIERGILSLLRLRARKAPRDAIDKALLVLGRDLLRRDAAAEIVARVSFRLGLKGPKPAQFSVDSEAMDFFSFLDDLHKTLAAIGDMSITHAAGGAVPSILPKGALADLMARVPTFAPTMESVARAYTDTHAFAAARAVDAVVTEKVRDAINASMIAGKGESDQEALVSGLTGWGRDYAQVVVRTNTTAAYAAGRFAEAEDMKREGIRVVALKFVAILDGRERENHRACSVPGQEIIADVDDPIWMKISPPLGFRCRCQVVPIDAIDIPAHLFTPDGRLKRAVLPQGAHADRGPHGEDLGFGRRPGRFSSAKGGRGF